MLVPLSAGLDIDLDRIKFARYFRSSESDFGVKLFTRGARSVPEHSHDNIQVSIPLGNTIAYVSWRSRDGTLHHAVAHRGHALIIPAHQRHAIAWKNRAYFVNFHLPVTLFEGESRGFLKIIDRIGEAHVITDPFLARLGEIVVTLAATTDGLDERMLQGISAILRAHVVHPYSEAARQIVIPPLEAAVGTSSAKVSGGRKTSALAPAQLRAVTNAVRNDLARDWSAGELAALVGRSVGHFSRAFRTATGSAPRQWIIQQRIESALDRLTLTDDSLVDIAHDCGFTDQTHFTRTFSRIVGTSPGAWRRRHATRPKQPGPRSRPAN